MTCRVCDTPTIEWLDLGSQPLANALTKPGDPPLPTYPLVVARCPSCGLSQLTHTVPPEQLYTDYPYETGVSHAFTAHCRALAAEISAILGKRGGCALDIASNDGTLIGALNWIGYTAAGIEPCQRLADKANAMGRTTTCRYFPEGGTHLIPSGAVQVVTSLNVLGHVPDPHAFAAEVARLLRPDGVWVVEVPWVKELLVTGAFDTIYHEHLTYWSAEGLARLGRAHGLGLWKWSYQPVHGGTLRVYFWNGPAVSLPGEGLLLEPLSYDGFKHRMRQRQEAWSHMWWDHRTSLAAYGASAKGAVFAHVATIDSSHVQYVVDETPAKQGSLTSYGVPIVPPSHLLDHPVEAVWITPWNHADEIRAKLPPGTTGFTA